MIIRLTGALALSALASALVLGTPEASRIWAWVITGLQVLGLRAAAGRRSSWGWLLGFSVQPVWIAYAAATDQWGFVLGCVVSAAVQLRNYVRVASPDDGTPSDDASPVTLRRWQWWPAKDTSRQGVGRWTSSSPVTSSGPAIRATTRRARSGTATSIAGPH